MPLLVRFVCEQRLAILQERLHAPGAMTEKQLALVQQDVRTHTKLQLEYLDLAFVSIFACILARDSWRAR